MLMPGRRGYLQTGGTSSGGAGGGSGSGLPVDLGLSERNGNQPAEYKATNSIEFVDGFVSGSGDEFVAYITTEQTGGGGSAGYNWVMDGNAGYRYGFNGIEKDIDIRGEGNALEFSERNIYDPRIGRFVSVDPNYRSLPDFSGYQYARNNPVFLKENGQDGIIPKWMWRTGLIDPLSAGFIDAIGDDAKGMWSTIKVVGAFMPPPSTYFHSPEATLIRHEATQMTKTVLTVMSNPILRTIVAAQVYEKIGTSVKNADFKDYQYASGYAAWNVLSFFVGVGEASAFAKTGKVGVGLEKFLGILNKSENKVNHLANIVKRTATHLNQTEWHHVIPDNLINNSVVQAAIQDGYKFGERLENLIPLEKFLTKNGNGVHAFAPKYDAQIQKAISQFEDLNPGYNNQQARSFLEDIKQQILKRVDENPSTKLNDLKLKLEVKKY